MNIADSLIKKILADAMPSRREEWVPADETPIDFQLPTEFFIDAPDLEIFQNSEPDSAAWIPDSPGSLSVLGTYRWMSSPGLITLYRGNIEAYWKSLLRHGQQHFPFVTEEDARYVLDLVVNSVYQHERFHYICDFCRRLFGSQFDRLHEESLAVAHTWQWVRAQGGNTICGRLHPTLRRVVVQARFGYRSPGYRDWRQFASRADFHAAVAAYLYPASKQNFAGTAFNFAAWAVARVADDGNPAWEEKISA